MKTKEQLAADYSMTFGGCDGINGAGEPPQYDQNQYDAFLAGYTASQAASDLRERVLKEALLYVTKDEPINGGDGSCTYCDMGAAGYSSLGQGHHDDIRHICPVARAIEALATYNELKTKGE